MIQTDKIWIFSYTEWPPKLLHISFVSESNFIKCRVVKIFEIVWVLRNFWTR
jgi:hypothetical protein